jgi:hypothetical protein
MSWGKKTKHSTIAKNLATSAAHFNPSRFSSALTEVYYVKGLGLAVRLGIEKSELVEWLRKKYSDSQASMALADRLAACKTDHRCRSAACPKCSHAAQAFTTEVVGKFFASHPDRDKIVVVSIVPVDGEVAKGKLTADQHARNVRRWKEAMGRAGVTWFIGATDWSFNEHKDQRYPSKWQHHIYGFTATDDRVQLKKQLKKLFPKTDATPRPVKVRVWDGGEKAGRYMLKPEFWRRIDQIGIQGRLMMKWLQIIHVGGLGWSIVDRAPRGRVRGNGPSR